MQSLFQGTPQSQHHSARHRGHCMCIQPPEEEEKKKKSQRRQEVAQRVRVKETTNQSSFGIIKNTQYWGFSPAETSSDQSRQAQSTWGGPGFISLFLTVSLHRNWTLRAAFGRLLQEEQGGLIPPPSERRLLLHHETLRGGGEIRSEMFSWWNIGSAYVSGSESDPGFWSWLRVNEVWIFCWEQTEISKVIWGRTSRIRSVSSWYEPVKFSFLNRTETWVETLAADSFGIHLLNVCYFVVEENCFIGQEVLLDWIITWQGPPIHNPGPFLPPINRDVGSALSLMTSVLL